MLKKNSSLLTFAAIALFVSTLFSFKCSKESTFMQTFNDNDYKKEWKTIDSLEQQGLPKSALEKVLVLYERTKKDKNPAQTIKCIIYRGKYESQLEEDGLVKAIAKMEEEAENATSPVKSVLQSMLAEFYNNYMQQNRWRIQQRTNTADFDNPDIQTWTIEQFSDKVMELYKASIQDPELRRVRINEFDAITTKGLNTDQERPTLFDFLGHRAIDYFMNERSYLTQPTFRYYLDESAYFDEADAFAKMNIAASDTKSGKYQALLLLQELIRAHLNDRDKEALINADLKRLKFVHQNSILGDKDLRYITALELLKDKYPKSKANAEVLFELGNYYYNKANQYVNDRDAYADNQFDYKKALTYYERAKKEYPKSYGAVSSINMINNIENKQLNLQAEQVIVPDEASLALVRYRNVDKLHFKIIKSTYVKIENLQRENSKDRIKTLNNQDPIESWSIDLPNPGDYQPHSTEIKVPALPVGQYILMASSSSKFNQKENGLVYTTIFSSHISYWTQRVNNNSETNFVVTNRKTGAPMPGVTAKFTESYYHQQSRSQKYRDAGEAISDKDGFVDTNLPINNNYNVVFSKDKDVLDMSDRFTLRQRQKRRDRNHTHFFLDRKIYRPGQTVYFKALAINYDSEQMPSIISKQDITLTFFDVNRQKVDEIKLKTNEYGTVNGSFTAPKSGLLGNMRINSSLNGSVSFRVEEYKRPKFEVKMDAVEGSYKLGDQVKITGLAKAYAGSNIDGAEVSYRVVRNINYPYFPWWRYGGYYFRPPLQGKSEEIAFGKTKTDAAGKFEIEFEAKPDKESKEKDQPVFIYQVIVDVIDITGETHSATGTARIGYVALQASVGVQDLMNRDSLRSIEISTKNLNNQFEPASGTVTVKSLKTPNKAFVERYWKKPDQWYLSKEAYKKDFPLFAYQNEDNMTSWSADKTVAELTFNTADSKTIELPKSKLETGAYLLVLKTKDKFGKDIELRKFFTLYDLDEKNVPSNDRQFFVMEKSTFEPGDKATFYIGSKETPTYFLYEVEHDGKLQKREWLKLNELHKESLNVKEKHRGNFHFHLTSVNNNRFYNRGNTISVPYTNKVLDIEYSTFRDKLYPGQDEEWRIKISGHKKDKVAAEMVAAMYDASLDVFAANHWSNRFYPTRNASMYNSSSNFRTSYGYSLSYWRNQYENYDRQYRYLNWFGFNFYGGGFGYENDGVELLEMAVTAAPEADDSVIQKSEHRYANFGIKSKMAGEGDALTVTNANAAAGETAGLSSEDSDSDGGFDDVAVRTNLNETVFFMPELMTDADGNVILKFKMNEALTRWKFMSFAHTKDLKTGYSTNEVVTQKDLMVMPNAPRFFREGDEIEFTAKVSNLTENKMEGTAVLQLFNAVTNEPVNSLLGLGKAEVPFTAEGGQSARLAWRLKVPIGEVPAITHRVVAKAGKFSDGEESSLPVLSNRMLVTETMPLPVRGKETKEFKFKKLSTASNSNTLQHHKVTLEFTSNPAWYAVQALPYLMEYPYDCIEQVFSRYYANSLATSVANSHPKIRKVFDQWRDTDAMLSNLTKNQELKSAILEETPWVLAAQSEEQQKKNIGLLFDLVRMAEERDQAMAKIQERQQANGGFSWFPGGRDSWYITQYIVEGLGHLDALGVKDIKADDRVSTVTNKAVLYTDDRLVDHYNEIKRRVEEGHDKWENDHLSQIVIHYLYSRSFYDHIPQSDATVKVADYFMGQVNKYWTSKNQYLQGMLALAMHRNGDKTVPANIVKSLKERSLYNDEMGMYWKYDRGFYWYQLPIETHAMMIEVFDEVAKDEKAVDDLKVWMLKNKQTNHWKTTKATSSAVYALLSRGDNWLLEDAPVQISMGGKQIDVEKLKPEAGTGYIKTSWDGKKVSEDMADVKVTNPNNVVAWGAMYWQYFEQLDKITIFEETPLTIKKQLFLEENTDRGPKITPITDGTTLNPGDKLKVRIELRVDRSMEYVHMKDMRASGFEPINVLSTYKWQAGLGYYESTRDASTNFFFSRLPKGTHVFEYPLRVNHKGDFSNGITTVQCMYAPEFSSHSEGVRVNVE